MLKSLGQKAHFAVDKTLISKLLWFKDNSFVYSKSLIIKIKTIFF